MQNMYSTAGRPEEALAGLDNIKQRIQAGDPNEGLLIQVELDRVAALIQLERYEAARSTLNQLIEEIERLYTPDSIDEFRAMQLDAQLIAAEGDAEEAVRRLENLETKARAVLPARSMRRGYLLTALAEIEFDRGAYASAEAWARKALEFWQSIFRNVSITQARILVGRACLEAGKTECAREELVPAIESFSALYGPDHPRMAELEADLDRLLHAD
jgi:tetratricopeptide (TPR) repeat protein